MSIKKSHKPDYSKMTFAEKVRELSMVIPWKFRVGSGVGKFKQVGQKKEYDSYLVVPYITSRDAMARLDEVFGVYRQRIPIEIAGKAYMSISLYDDKTQQRISRADVGAKTAIASEKGEASDSFKRACVNWGLGRFLYNMPVMYITNKEMKENKNITTFIKHKYREDLEAWVGKENIDIINKRPVYKEENEEIEIIEDENIIEENNFEKKEWTKRHYSLFVGKHGKKSKDEILKEFLDVQKEYEVSEELRKEINIFLSSLNSN